MTFSSIHYELCDEFIDNWLVAGTQAIKIPIIKILKGCDFKKSVANHFYKKESCISELPVEHGGINDGYFSIDNFKGKWSYYKCLEDHFIELSSYQSTYVFLRSWSFSQIKVASSCEVEFIFTITGPFNLWLNDVHIFRQDNFYQTKKDIKFNLNLIKGINRILIRFEEIGQGNCLLTLALRIKKKNSGNSKIIKVLLPTTIKDVEHRNKFEKIFNEAYLDQKVYSRDDQIIIRWPEKMSKSEDVTLRLQTPNGQIFKETHLENKSNFALMANTYEIPGGEYQLLLIPPASLYYEQNLRIKHEIKLWCLGNNKYSQELYGTFDERRQEALLRASTSGENLFAQIAKMAINWWSRINFEVIKKTITEIDLIQKEKNFDTTSALLRNQLGLIKILYQFRENPSIPEEIKKDLQRCILDFNFLKEDSIEIETIYEYEKTILLHTNEILAGQLFPNLLFNRSSKKGKWHCKEGEKKALKWMKILGSKGCFAWDSDSYFEDFLIALSQLVEFAKNEDVMEMATVLMDKLFFQIAVNSFKGVFGSSKGNARLTDIQSGLLSPISSISRLMWGMGVFNHQIQGLVCLACLEEYGFPRFIQEIANDSNDEILNMERHLDPSGDLEVKKITYKTPDTMLSSAQNFQPGKRGLNQHIWQATLGPEAIVFVNHPFCSSENESQSPNYWRGNAFLPRVVQWRDVLISIHEIPQKDWMYFTHAYFPAYAFDEYIFKENWVFARKGSGYIALTSFNELKFIKSGPNAYCEIRAYGIGNTWLCHMGREKLDDNFDTFKERILQMDLELKKLSVQLSSLRGDTLKFGWDENFYCNEELHSISDFKHIENPYCVAELNADTIEIKFNNQGMILNLG